MKDEENTESKKLDLDRNKPHLLSKQGGEKGSLRPNQAETMYEEGQIDSSLIHMDIRRERKYFTIRPARFYYYTPYQSRFSLPVELISCSSLHTGAKNIKAKISQVFQPALQLLRRNPN